MKRFVILFLTLAVTSFFAPCSRAADNPGDKLTRGVVNVITAPIEIAKQIDAGWKESNKKTSSVSAGILSGFAKGIAYTAGRMGSGVWDILSFPFKTPGNYDPLMKPEFVLDKDNPDKSK